MHELFRFNNIYDSRLRTTLELTIKPIKINAGNDVKTT